MSAPMYGLTPKADKRILDLRMAGNIEMWMAIQHYPEMIGSEKVGVAAHYRIKVWTTEREVIMTATERAVRESAMDLLEFTADQCISRLLEDLRG